MSMIRLLKTFFYWSTSLLQVSKCRWLRTSVKTRKIRSVIPKIINVRIKASSNWRYSESLQSQSKIPQKNLIKIKKAPQIQSLNFTSSNSHPRQKRIAAKTHLTSRILLSIKLSEQYVLTWSTIYLCKEIYVAMLII